MVFVWVGQNYVGMSEQLRLQLHDTTCQFVGDVIENFKAPCVWRRAE